MASSLNSSPLSIAAATTTAVEEFGVPAGGCVSFFVVLLHGSPEVAICWSLRCQRPEVGLSLFVLRRSTPARSICNGETRERGSSSHPFFSESDPFPPNAREAFVFYWQCSIKDIMAKWKNESFNGAVIIFWLMATISSLSTLNFKTSMILISKLYYNDLKQIDHRLYLTSRDARKLLSVWLFLT